MASINLIDAFQEFKDAENIDRPTMMKVVEDVFKTLLRKKYGSDENFDVIVNAEKGDLEIIRRRMIMDDDDVNDPNEEVSITYARSIQDDYEVGEELYQEVDMFDFGRRAILAAKQTLASRIADLKKNVLVKKYEERIGEIVSVEVYQVWKKEVLCLDEEGNELILPKSEQIPQDFFKKGENTRAVVARVDLKNNSPVIILSRTNPMLDRKSVV
jgi:N utilization substance protein A